MSAAQEKSKSINWILLGFISLLLLASIWIGMRLFFPNIPTFFGGTEPSNIGIDSGKLVPCPSTPNCVSSSESEDEEHYINPIRYNSSAPEAIAALKQIILNEDRAKLVTETDNCLYAQFTSKWMGFVDDVEFFANRGVIDVRSASRLGESDLGVNRQRIEKIRTQLNQTYNNTIQSNIAL